MDLNYLTLFILTMAAATFVTRALPFWVFRGRQQHPVILYLGRYLPPAVMTLLVLYSLKEVNWLAGNHGLPEMLSLTVVVFTHLLFNNTLVSIFSGTFLYMALIQNSVF